MADPIYKRPTDLAESFKKEEEKPTETQTEKMEEGKKDWSKVNKDLVLDEEEAITAYDGAIKFIEEQTDMPEDVKAHYLEVLKEIKADEEDHIKKLNEIKGESTDGE